MALSRLRFATSRLAAPAFGSASGSPPRAGASSSALMAQGRHRAASTGNRWPRISPFSGTPRQRACLTPPGPTRTRSACPWTSTCWLRRPSGHLQHPPLKTASVLPDFSHSNRIHFAGQGQFTSLDQKSVSKNENVNRNCTALHGTETCRHQTCG